MSGGVGANVLAFSDSARLVLGCISAPRTASRSETVLAQHRGRSRPRVLQQRAPQGAVSLARCSQVPGECSLGSPTLQPRLCPRQLNDSFSFRLLFFLVFWGLKTLAQFLGETQS